MDDDRKSCSPVPCPPFEGVSVEVTAVCSCWGRILPGRQYASGCRVHDPLVVGRPHPQANCGPLALPLAAGESCPTCGVVVPRG